MRTLLGGTTNTERMAITALALAHGHLTITAVANGMKAHRVPRLADFVPEPPDAEPKKPLDIRGWNDALMAAFAG